MEQWINGPAGSLPVLDTIMKAAATLAEPLFAAIVVVWFLAGWWTGRPQERRGAVAALIAAAGALLVNLIIGHLWARPRPFVAHPTVVHLLVAHSTDASFPSDHAAAAFAIGVVLVVAHRRLGILALAAAVLLSYARVYVGDHYPGDVAGGAVIGVLAALAVLIWLRPIPTAVSRAVDVVLARSRLLSPRG